MKGDDIGNTNSAFVLDDLKHATILIEDAEKRTDHDG